MGNKGGECSYDFLLMPTLSLLMPCGALTEQLTVRSATGQT